MNLGDVLGWYDAAMSELETVLSSVGTVPIGPPGGLYDNELFTEERGMMVVYMPVDVPPTRGRVEPFDVHATDLDGGFAAWAAAGLPAIAPPPAGQDPSGNRHPDRSPR